MRSPSDIFFVAAFEPFGRRDVNASWQAVRLVRGAGVERILLPVDFAALRTIVPALVRRRPRALLLVGEAGRRRRLSVERVALNVAHARLADNAGERPHLEKLVARGPAALLATWDVDAALAALRAARLPCAISHHAGTFACNASLYYALHAAPSKRLPIGFLHVPTSGVTPAAIARGIERLLPVMTRRSA